MAKHDILERKDVELLVDSFYTKVKADDVIGYIFNKVEHFNWETHIPIMYTFWETVLLGNAGYKGNPVVTHVKLNRQIPLNKPHFEQWLRIFYVTIDEHFDGENAQKAKQKATLMADLIQIKIEDSFSKQYIQ